MPWRVFYQGKPLLSLCFFFYVWKCLSRASSHNLTVGLANRNQSCSGWTLHCSALFTCGSVYTVYCSLIIWGGGLGLMCRRTELIPSGVAAPFLHPSNDIPPALHPKRKRTQEVVCTFFFTQEVVCKLALFTSLSFDTLTMKKKHLSLIEPRVTAGLATFCFRSSRWQRERERRGREQEEEECVLYSPCGMTGLSCCTRLNVQW